MKYFSSGIFAIYSEFDKFHLFDTSGNQLIEPFYGGVDNSWNESWPDGWRLYRDCETKKDKEYGRISTDECLCGFINKNYEIILEPLMNQYASFRKTKFGDYKNGWLKIEDGNELFGFIDTLGNIVVTPKYEVIERFSPRYNGLAKIGYRQYGLLDTLGNEILPRQYLEINDFGSWYGDLSLAKRIDRKYGILNSKGEIVVEARYDQIGELGEFHPSWVLIQDGFKQGFIDTLGQIIVPPIYNRTMPVDSGYEFTLLSRKDNKYGLLDTLGNEVVPFKYEEILKFSAHLKELAAIKQKGKYGFIDRNFNVVIKPQYKYIYERRDDWGDKIVAQKKNGKLFWIDKNAKITKYEGQGVLAE